VEVYRSRGTLDRFRRDGHCDRLSGSLHPIVHHSGRSQQTTNCTYTHHAHTLTINLSSFIASSLAFASHTHRSTIRFSHFTTHDQLHLTPTVQLTHPILPHRYVVHIGDNTFAHEIHAGLLYCDHTTRTPLAHTTPHHITFSRASLKGLSRTFRRGGCNSSTYCYPLHFDSFFLSRSFSHRSHSFHFTHFRQRAISHFPQCTDRSTRSVDRSSPIDHSSSPRPPPSSSSSYIASIVLVH
jgi:hypothetical protein